MVLTALVMALEMVLEMATAVAVETVVMAALKSEDCRYTDSTVQYSVYRTH